MIHPWLGADITIMKLCVHYGGNTWEYLYYDEDNYILDGIF